MPLHTPTLQSWITTTSSCTRRRWRLTERISTLPRTLLPLENNLNSFEFSLINRLSLCCSSALRIQEEAPQLTVINTEKAPTRLRYLFPTLSIFITLWNQHNNFLLRKKFCPPSGCGCNGQNYAPVTLIKNLSENPRDRPDSAWRVENLKSFCKIR